MDLRNEKSAVTIGEMTPEKIIAFREKFDLSQEELAAALKVSRNTVNRWENRKRAIPHIVDVALETVERKLSVKESK